MIGWFGEDARMERGYRLYLQYECIYRSTVPTLCVLITIAALLFVLSHVNRVTVAKESDVAEAKVLAVYKTRRDYLPTTHTLAAGFVSPTRGRVHALIEVSDSERRNLQSSATVRIRHSRDDPGAATLAHRAPMNSVADGFRLLGWGFVLLSVIGLMITPLRGSWLKRQRVIYADYVPGGAHGT